MCHVFNLLEHSDYLLYIPCVSLWSVSYSRGNALVLFLSLSLPLSLSLLFYTLSKRYNCCQLDIQTYKTALTSNVLPSINFGKSGTGSAK